MPWWENSPPNYEEVMSSASLITAVAPSVLQSSLESSVTPPSFSNAQSAVFATVHNAPNSQYGVLRAVAAFGQIVVTPVAHILGLAARMMRSPVILLLSFQAGLFVTNLSAFDNDFPICSVYPTASLCPNAVAADVAFYGSIRRPSLMTWDHYDVLPPAQASVHNPTIYSLLAYSSSFGLRLSLSVDDIDLEVRNFFTGYQANDIAPGRNLSSSIQSSGEEAQTIVRELQYLSAGIRAVMDGIFALHTTALQTVAAQSTFPESRSTDAMIWMLTSIKEALAVDVGQTIIKAGSISRSVAVLEEKLLAVHTTCGKETASTNDVLNGVLSEFWTLIGGNGLKLRALARKADVLRRIDRYYDASIAHTTTITEFLLKMEADLMVLRDKLESLAFVDGNIPTIGLAGSMDRFVLDMIGLGVKWEVADLQGDFARAGGA